MFPADARCMLIVERAHMKAVCTNCAAHVTMLFLLMLPGAYASAVVYQHCIDHSDPIYGEPPSALSAGSNVRLYSANHAEMLAEGTVADWPHDKWGQCNLRSAKAKKVNRAVIKLTTVDTPNAYCLYSPASGTAKVTLSVAAAADPPLVLWDVQHLRLPRQLDADRKQRHCRHSSREQAGLYAAGV